MNTEKIKKTIEKGIASGALTHWKGQRSMPVRVKQAYFSKMQHYNEYKNLVNGMLDRKDIETPQKLENLAKQNSVAKKMKEQYSR